MQSVFSGDRLIIFGRYPVPGKTKTRLIPALGPAGAANLQRLLTEKTFLTAKDFAAKNSITVECCFEGGTQKKICRWLGSIPLISFQLEGDLGQRMRSALFDALRKGNKRVVLLGTDIPGVSTEILKEAFGALLKHDIVLGPSTDGGYWLMGLKQPTDLFQDIGWGTGKVLEQTLARIRGKGLKVRLLKPLPDMDTPADLKKWRPETGFRKPFLTVIIPTLNEAEHIRSAILSAKDRDTAVLVVDGGSTDHTVARALEAGAQVISCPPSRALQQNRGALMATGTTLLFLHADTRLPEGYVPLVFETLMGGSVLGAFRFRTDLRHPLIKVFEWGAHFRSAFLHLPYGDQALFMEKSTFEKAGGFPPAPVAEDFFFVRNLIKHKNIRVVMAMGEAVTSGRRWKTLGLFKTTWINQLILAGIFMGVSLQTLSRLYRAPLKKKTLEFEAL